MLCAQTHAWLVPVADEDDPINPKKLRTDIPVLVKSNHFTDVVAYVDSERGPTECNLTPYAWPPTLLPEINAEGVITTTHINEVRAGVRQMYQDYYGAGWSCVAQFPPGTPGGTLCETANPGDFVYTAHIDDLRHSFGANFNTNNVCDLFPPVVVTCGNGGAPEAGETCDDGNLVDGDGCSATCQCEYSWLDETCGGPTDTECPMIEMYQNGTSLSAQCAPSTQCVANPACGGPVCGNTIVEVGETCEDDNNINGDGCSSACECEYLWVDGPCGGPTGAECLANEIYQTGTSLWAGCASTTQCVASIACDVGCGGCTAWTDVACGAYSFCPRDQMKQARTCGGLPGCVEWQCLPASDHPECATCGDGDADAGETQDNCCLDMGCPMGPNPVCHDPENMCYPT